MGWVVIVTEVVAVVEAVVPAGFDDDCSFVLEVEVGASVARGCCCCCWSVTVVVVVVVVVASGKVVTGSLLVSCCCCGCGCWTLSGLSIGTCGDSGRVWLASDFSGEALVE